MTVHSLLWVASKPTIPYSYKLLSCPDSYQLYSQPRIHMSCILQSNHGHSWYPVSPRHKEKWYPCSQFVHSTKFIPNVKQNRKFHLTLSMCFPVNIELFESQLPLTTMVQSSQIWLLITLTTYPNPISIWRGRVYLLILYQRDYLEQPFIIYLVSGCSNLHCD